MQIVPLRSGVKTHFLETWGLRWPFQIPVTPEKAATQTTTPQISTASLMIAGCCLAVICALVLGVGLASNLVLRHVVQTLPLWVAVVLGFRQSRLTGWIALPCLIFRLLLMAVIWCYLLGISPWINGQFSVIEIATTVIVGVASLAGIVSFARFRSSLSPAVAAVLFIGMGAVQLAGLRISFSPGDRTPLIPSRRFWLPVLPGAIFLSGESELIAAPTFRHFR